MARIPGWLRRIFGKARQAATEAVVDEGLNAAGKVLGASGDQGGAAQEKNCPTCGKPW